MNKFTIFTIILAVSVITVTTDLAVRERYNKSGQASVANEEISPIILNSEEQDSAQTQEQADSAVDEENAPTGTTSEPRPVVVESIAPIPAPPTTLTQELIDSAGFNAAFAEKHFDGRLYRLLDITKTPVDALYHYELSAEGTPIAAITEIVLRDEIRALALYVLLQNKTKPYIDLSLNETNAYGDRSFYINHAKKPEEAFLTVKIKNRLYGFAYVKFYHPELKKLIQLLTP